MRGNSNEIKGIYRTGHVSIFLYGMLLNNKKDSLWRECVERLLTLGVSDHFFSGV